MLFEPPIAVAGRPPSPPPHYLIMTSPRTGSTLLSNAIASHSQITGGNEIFAKGRDAARTYLLQALYGVSWKFGEQASLNCFPDLTPYLEYFTSRLNGFKLLYGQLDEFPYLWDQLFGVWSDLSVIYLERNLPDCIVSHYLTKSRAVYHKRPDEYVDVPTRMEVPMTEVPLYFESFVVPKIQYQRILSRFRRLTIQYEHMVSEWDDVCQRLEIFLHIKTEKLPQTLRKLLPNPREFVLNYDDIERECFKLAR